MTPSQSHVWIKIHCGSCGRTWDVRINRDWLDKSAVNPDGQQCAKCKEKAKRFARRWHEDANQLRFRFDAPNEGGQGL